MFEEPGNKLKKLAVILFWGITIASVILAFTLGIERVHYTSSASGLVYTTTVFHDVLFFSFLLGGAAGRIPPRPCPVRFWRAGGEFREGGRGSACKESVSDK